MRSTSILIALCSLALSIGTQTRAQDFAARTSLAPPRVVFVCEHGSVKSLVAMQYFNRRAEAQGLAYRAVARRTAPEPTVPTAVRDGLRSDGFEVSTFEPRKFEASDVDRASLIVSFDQDVASFVGARVRYLKWDDLPGVLTDFTRGKDAIVRHVDALLDELARGRSQ
jgi:arsenate reductase (thioredoxin)